MTRLDHHIAVVNACDTAYMVSVMRPAGLYYRIPEKVRDGCQGLLDSNTRGLEHRAHEALSRCRDAAYDADRMRHPEKRAAATRVACDAFFAAMGLAKESYHRWLVAGNQREL